MKLRTLENKNYNAKISKLEWKKMRITQDIKSEKKLFSTYEKLKKKVAQLQVQMEKNIDAHRKQRFINVIHKLDQKIIKVEKEIAWINERNEYDKEKIADIDDLINALRTELSNIEKPSKKEKEWYKKRIKKFQIKRDELKEGRNNLKLRLTIEKLAEYKNKNEENILKYSALVDQLSKKVWYTVPLTARVDKQIAKYKSKHSKDSDYKKELKEWNKYREEFLQKEREKIEWKIIEVEADEERLNLKTKRIHNKYFGPENEGTPTRKGGFAKSWKGILMTTLFIVSFGLLTTAYVLNNSYDIVIGNWGSYIDPALINQFEEENDVTINYQQYDSNESLYNKTKSFDYDIMVPSDYMAVKLMNEKSLAKIDYSKLTSINAPNKSEVGKAYEANTTKDTINFELQKQLANQGLTDYALPYFWGNVEIAFNTQNKKVRDFLEDTTQKTSWQVLWDAADAGLNVRLNEDAKNIYMIANELLGQGVQPTNEQQLSAASKKVKSLLTKKTVSLHGDDLITKVETGDFDVAVMYNGDLVYAQQTYAEEHGITITDKPVFDVVVAQEGTNLWSDNMVINKNNRNIDLSYKFIDFIYAHSAEISKYVGATSVLTNAATKVSNELPEALKPLYNIQSIGTGTSKGAPFKLYPELDDQLINDFNTILGNKN